MPPSFRRNAMVTSVAIPLALTGICSFLVGRAVYNMSLGVGKID